MQVAFSSKRTQVPFIYITLTFIAGMLVGYYKPYTLFWVRLFVFGLVSANACLVVIYQKRLPLPLWLNLLSTASIFLVGYVCFLQQMPEQDPYHLVHCATRITAYEAIVVDTPKTRKKTLYTTVAIKKACIQGDWLPIRGKIKLEWYRDSLPMLAYGDRLLIKGKPQEVAPRVSKHAFDYKGYLAISGIHHQQFVQGKEVCVYGVQPSYTLMKSALLTRNFLAKRLKKYITHPDAQGLALALVLGIRQELRPELKTTYIGVGAIHVLAVSGLHVGLLYALILFLLGLLAGLLGRKSNLIGRLLALLLLWCYAFITGLAPSIMRTVSMFSLFTMAQLLQRTYNPANILASSALILLVYDAMLLFSVGFQLSYAAVLGIIYLHPPLYNLFDLSKNLWLSKFWNATAISLAAQLATLPLSLYYFHWFPTYFLLANWGVIPAVSIILCLGFLLIPASYFPIISIPLVWIITKLTILTNLYALCLYKLPYSQLGPIFISKPIVFCLYAILISLWKWLNSRKFGYLLLASCSALVLVVVDIYNWIG